VTDTPYKRTEPPLAFSAAAPSKVSNPSGLYSAPFADSLRAQDSIFGSRRIVFDSHTGGSSEWLTPSKSITSGAQNMPTDVWRVVGRARCETAPGQAFEARILALPSGPVVAYEPSSAKWVYTSAGGRVRITLDHDNGTDTGSTVFERHLPASDLEDQLEPQGTGQAWLDLQCHYLPPALPPGATLEAAEAAKWSEPHTIDVTYEHRGGVRLLAVNVAEVPADHVVAHDTDATTLHDYSASQGQPFPDARPQESSADGATYEERRNGTQRGLKVATRQRTHHVPGPLIWTSYTERTTEVDDTEADPVQVTSTSWVRFTTMADNQFGYWDANAAGFDLLGHYAARAPENLATRVDGVLSLPLLARVYARFTTTGPQTGRVVWSSSARSRFGVTITAGSSSWAWWSARGWLEATASPSDTYPVLQEFAKVTAGTLEVRAMTFAIGDFAVG